MQNGLILQVQIIFSHLKVRIAAARHNFKWLENNWNCLELYPANTKHLYNIYKCFVFAG